MADPKTGIDLLMKYDTAGTIQVQTRVSRRTVVGPASYAADGIPVDLSGVFSTLHDVKITRAYVTSTGVTDTRLYEINEAGTDTIANRKFRVKVFRTPTPAGTNGTPGTTTNANVISATGAVTSDGGNVASSNNVIALGSCGALSCDGDSLQTTDGSSITNLQGVLKATGSVKVTAVLTVDAPSFTGTAPTTTKTEIDAATNLSTLTVEYVATGVAV